MKPLRNVLSSYKLLLNQEPTHTALPYRYVDPKKRTQLKPGNLRHEVIGQRIDHKEITNPKLIVEGNLLKTELLLAVEKELELVRPTEPLRGVIRAYRSLGEKLPDMVEPAPSPCKILNKKKEVFLCSWIEQQEKLGVIELARGGEWRSALNLIPKQAKGSSDIELTYRVILDARNINTRFKKVSSSGPLLKDLLRRATQAPWMAILDVKDAFYHIILNKQDRLYFGMSTPYGTYRFKRLPMGFVNGPAIQQQFMGHELDLKVTTRLIKDGIQAQIATYVDDILVTAESRADLINAVKHVLKRAGELNLTIEQQSIQFGSTVKYLGKEFDYHDNFQRIGQKHIDKANTLKSPQTNVEVSRFISFLQYLSEHLPNFPTLIRGFQGDETNSFDRKRWHTIFQESIKAINHAEPLVAVANGQDLQIQTHVLFEGYQAVARTSQGLVGHKFKKHYPQQEELLGSLEKEAAAARWAVQVYADEILRAGRAILISSDPLFTAVASQSFEELIRNKRISPNVVACVSDIYMAGVEVKFKEKPPTITDQDKALHLKFLQSSYLKLNSCAKLFGI